MTTQTRYCVRWEIAGRVHFLRTDAMDSALAALSALTEYLKGNRITVQLWSGSNKMMEVQS